MARQKVLKTQEEISAVPQDQPVHIELPPELPLTASSDAPFPEKPIEMEVEKSAPVKRVKADEEDKDETINAFKAQLEGMKKAEELAKAQAAETAQRLAEAEKRAEEREKEYRSATGRADQSEYDSVLNAIGAATAEAEAAQHDVETAMTNQDGKALAEAQRRISRAETRLIQLEDGKISLEERRAQREEEMKSPPQQRQNPTIEQHIDSVPNLLASERSWLKAHPDAITDARKNARMQAAHFDAEDAGYPRGSNQYFHFMEEKLGYRKPEPTMDEEDDFEPERTPVVAAPVSRDAPSPSSGKPVNGNRITLTPEQREIAKMSGISDIEYARQFLKLNEHKRNGMYRDN